jgi:hypothetical protein
MKRDKQRRLTLNRETLLRLDERKLAGAGPAAQIDPINWSRDKLCTSPLCVETTCGCAVDK